MQCEQILIPTYISQRDEGDLAGIDYGIVSENKSRKTGIAIIPDHHVTWIMRVKRIEPLDDYDFKKPHWQATHILALFTDSQLY